MRTLIDIIFALLWLAIAIGITIALFVGLCHFVPWPIALLLLYLWGKVLQLKDKLER